MPRKIVKKYNKKNQKLTLRAYYMYKLAIRHRNLGIVDKKAINKATFK